MLSVSLSLPPYLCSLSFGHDLILFKVCACRSSSGTFSDFLHAFGIAACDLGTVGCVVETRCLAVTVWTRTTSNRLA